MKASHKLNIVLEDEMIVAVEKPAGLASIPGRAETKSLLEVLAAQIGIPCTGTADPRLRVVHRLDKDTSGVMVFAKSIEAQRFLSNQFQNNTIQKEYLAIVAGRPLEDHGEIDSPIAPHATDKLRMSVSKHGRPALTLWKVEKRFRIGALLRCFPKTGKTHQIRVHLASIGLPLMIDPLYERGTSNQIMLSSFKRDYRPTRDQKEYPLIARLTLHAHRLTFRHPAGHEVALEVPPPKDFRAAVNQMTKFA